MKPSDIPSLTAADVADACGVSRATAIRWMRAGKLNAVKVGGRYRTTRTWIDEFLSPVSPAVSSPMVDATTKNLHGMAMRSIVSRFGISVNTDEWMVYKDVSQ